MSEPIELLEAQEFWGEWWLPSSPETRFGGQLAYSPADGVSVKLAGGFESGQWEQMGPGARAYTGGVTEYPIVHGYVAGKPITLVGVTPTRSIGGIDPYEQTLVASDALLGVLLAAREERAFIGFECAIESVALWLGESSFSEHRGKPGDSLVTGIELHRQPAQTASSGSISFSIWHQWRVNGVNVSRGGYSAEMNDRPVVSVEFGSPASLADVKSIVQALQDLITFIAREPSAVLSIRANLPRETETLRKGHPGRGLPRGVGVMTRQRGAERLASRSKRAPHLLITARELPFCDLVPRWLATREKHRAAVNLLLSLKFGGHAYLESRLLASVGAAESLSRDLDPPRPFSRGEHKRIQKAAAGAVDEAHHDWVLERLAANEAPLRERLEFLVDRLPGRVGDLVVHDRATWARLAVDARNQLSHAGRAPNHSVHSLLTIIDVTAAVVTLNLLMELGVPTSALSALVADSTLLGAVARRAHERFGSTRDGNR